MRLVVLYGPPGVGKLTVATELAALTGFQLFHNHLTFDLGSAVFRPFTPAWSRLVRELRVVVFEAVAREEVEMVVTFAPMRGDPREVELIRTILAPVWAAGGSILFVRLTCEREALLERVQQESRRAWGKLTDPNTLLTKFDLEARLPFEPQWSLDITQAPPAAAAYQIAAHFNLPIAPARASEARNPEPETESPRRL